MRICGRATARIWTNRRRAVSVLMWAHSLRARAGISRRVPDSVRGRRRQFVGAAAARRPSADASERTNPNGEYPGGARGLSADKRTEGVAGAGPPFRADRAEAEGGLLGRER